MVAIIRSAVSDFVRGLSMHRMWMALASEEISDQHKRTLLGPMWLLVSYVLFVSAFIVIFGGTASMPHFQVYVGVGMIVWLFIQDIMMQGVTLYLREENFIKGTRLPLTVYVMRLWVQSIIKIMYASIGLLAILIIYREDVMRESFYAVFGFAFVAAAFLPAIVVMAIAGAFFPDLQFIVNNLMRVGIFLTPIFWVPQQGTIRENLYWMNPFTHMIEIVRTPIIDGYMPVNSLMVVSVIFLALWIAAIFMLGKYRRDIAFLL